MLVRVRRRISDFLSHVSSDENNKDSKCLQISCSALLRRSVSPHFNKQLKGNNNRFSRRRLGHYSPALSSECNDMMAAVVSLFQILSSPELVSVIIPSAHAHHFQVAIFIYKGEAIYPFAAFRSIRARLDERRGSC